MSFGKNQSKSTQTQTSTEALDPDIKAALLSNVSQVKNFAGQPFQAFTGQRVAELTPEQLQAEQSMTSIANEHVGSGLLNQAANTASAVNNYKPLTITPTSYAPTTATASMVNRGDLRDVTTGAVTADEIGGYMSPYLQDVVDAQLADLNRQREIQQAYQKTEAIKNNAFGGTGSAVAASLLDENFLRQMASSSADLRNQGFQQALAAAQADKDRQLTASQANQSADLAVAAGNADRSQQANLFNAGAWNDASRFNAGQDQSAQQANQAAGLQGQQLNLSGAGLLGQIADQQRSSAIGDATLLSQVGAEQRAVQQAKLDAIYEEFLRAQDDPYKRQQLLNQALGLMGNPSLTQSQGSSISKSSGFDLSATSKKGSG